VVVHCWICAVCGERPQLLVQQVVLVLAADSSSVSPLRSGVRLVLEHPHAGEVGDVAREYRGQYKYNLLDEKLGVLRADGADPAVDDHEKHNTVPG